MMSGGQIETTQDIGTDKSAVVTRWLKELDLADAHEKKWRERSCKVIDRYRDERDDTANKNSERFNILYANTEVLKGVMYQKQPTPDVRRRYKDKDPIAKRAAEILNRAISYSLDAYDFDEIMRCVVEDYLLPGRGETRCRYVPTYSKETMAGEDGSPMLGTDGKPQYQVLYEEARCEYVEWEMYRQSPTKRISKLRWKAYGELLTREELNARFGDKGKRCSLDWMPKGKEDNAENQMYKRAMVWVVWNKPDRKVYTVCSGLMDEPLEVVDDPLRLEGFFPSPAGLYAIKTTNSTIPIPEYTQYQDQARELDEITSRINNLTKELKRRGVYDGSYEELKQLADADDNQFIAIQNYNNFADKGGLEKALIEAPIEGIAKVVIGLYQQRDQVKQTIYEITGISDIVRGSTNANETLGAQKIKAQYSNVRTGPRQSAIQKYARDIIRIKAEIISEHFSPDTLKLMTGPELWMVEQPNPQTGQLMPMDATEQIMQILRNDKLRGFKVDIETDSTIQPDADTEQQNRIELLTSVTGFLEKAIPAVQMGAIPMDVAKEMLLFGVRAFKTGTQLEDILDQWSNNKPADGESGQQQAQQQQQMQQMQMQMQQQQEQLQSAHADIQKRGQAVAQQEQSLKDANTQTQLEKMKLEYDKKEFALQQKVNQFMAEKAGKLGGAEVDREETDMLDQFMQSQQNVMNLMIQVAQKMDGVTQAMLATIQEVNKPKRLVRDNTGRAVGVESVDTLQ